MDITKLRSDPTTDKITDGKLKGTSSAQKTKKTSDAAAARNTVAPHSVEPSGAEKVRLSQDVRSIQEGVDAARQAPDVRSEKVAALKNSIKNGTYKVDEKAIAEKMLQNSIEEDLLTRME